MLKFREVVIVFNYADLPPKWQKDSLYAVRSDETQWWYSTFYTRNGIYVIFQVGSWSIAETDPIFSWSPAYGISSWDISNWDNAYWRWDHALAGYLTAETDPIYTSSSRYTTTNNASNRNSAYWWGNHALAWYLTSWWPETDPVYSASSWFTTTNNAWDRDTAYWRWDHASAWYLTAVYWDWTTITGSWTLLDPFVASAWWGHEIVDWWDNVMPQEDQLKFTSKFLVTDEPLNTRTVVDLNPDQIFDTLAFTSEYDNGNSWASKTIDWTIANNQKVTLTADCIFAFTALTWWVSRVQLKIIQDWTGWWNCFRPANVIRPNGYPTWTDWTPWQNCIITFYYDWTNYIAIATLYYNLP